MKVTKSFIQLKKIYLLDSIFSLGGFVSGEEVKMNIGIESQIDNVDSKFISSIVRVVLWHTEFKDFKIQVRMKGDFLVSGEITFKVEDFLGINAPSIIFPYIRQFVRHLSLEANLSPILLPVVDFVALYEARTKQSDKLT